LRKLWNAEVWIWDKRKNKAFYIIAAIIAAVFLVFSLLDRLFLWLCGLLLLVAITGWVFGLVKGDKGKVKPVDFKGTLFPPSLMKYLGLYRVHQIATVFMVIGYGALAIQITIWLWRTQIPTY
jgi:hypothetical protein